MKDSRLSKLTAILKNMESAVLAYSGGVDSAFLLKALQLSKIKTLAVTRVSEIFPIYELRHAEDIAKELGAEHATIKTEELSMKDFSRNTPDRCFFCKEELFRKLSAILLSGGYRFILDGTNIDDTFDYRPGRKAAEKYNVRSPLIEAGLNKSAIRELSRHLGLSTWDRPSSPCLATRFPYGHRLTKKALKKVEKAEGFLRSLGFIQIRVRDHGDMARIEVSEDKIHLLLRPEKRKRVSEKLKSLGYEFITIDLEGYRPGSLNRMLNFDPPGHL
jgi:uncharacterized protein